MTTNYITLRDAARETGRPFATLRSWYKKGVLLGRKSGTRDQDPIVVDKASLDKCLIAHPQRPIAAKSTVSENTSADVPRPEPEPPAIEQIPPVVESQPPVATHPAGNKTQKKKKNISLRKRLIQRAKGAIRSLEARDLIKLRNWTQNRLDGLVTNNNVVSQPVPETSNTKKEELNGKAAIN